MEGETTMQVSTKRDPSVERTAIRAVEGEWVSIWVNHVKADKWEQHERFVHDILMPATEKVDPPVFRHTRFLHPRERNEDGTYTSAWLVDPILEDGDYQIVSLLKKAYGEEKGQEYYQLWLDSIASRVMYAFIQSP
jgi:hypothetical protein